jgi:hypothetical protein
LTEPGVEKIEKVNPLAMNKETKMRLSEELKIYQDEKTHKEVLLDKLLKATNKTEEQIHDLESDKLQFNLMDSSHQDQKESNYNLTYIFRVL